MVIEPCCIARQLPIALRAGDRYFTSNGDWVLSQLMDSVACMVDGDGKMGIILAVDRLDIAHLRHLAWYFRRDWTHSLLLVTKENQLDAVMNELADYIGQVQYAVEERLSFNQITFAGDGKGLVVTGPLLMEPNRLHCMYSVAFGVDKNPVYEANATIFSRLRTKPLVRANDARTRSFIAGNYMFLADAL